MPLNQNKRISHRWSWDVSTIFEKSYACAFQREGGSSRTQKTAADRREKRESGAPKRDAQAVTAQPVRRRPWRVQIRETAVRASGDQRRRRGPSEGHDAPPKRAPALRLSRRDPMTGYQTSRRRATKRYPFHQRNLRKPAEDAIQGLSSARESLGRAWRQYDGRRLPHA